MKTPMLFDIPPDKGKSSRRALTEFKIKHDIRTHYAHHMRQAGGTWLAVLVQPEHKDHTLEKIMAKWCRLYDDAGLTATGNGELTTIRKLCRNNSIPCDL